MRNQLGDAISFVLISVAVLCGTLMSFPKEQPVERSYPEIVSYNSRQALWVEEDPEENEKIEQVLDWHDAGACTITAYCPCESCCGEYALDRPDGVVYTASGAVARQGVTIAVDPDVIPLGAWVEIGGVQYHAEDTGEFAGAVVDVYFENHSEASEFGVRRNVPVRWYFEEE